MIEININPIAFFGVRWYGIIVALGIAVLVLWVAWQVHREKEKKISLDTVFVAAIVGIPSGVVVSRAFHVIDLWDHYRQFPGEIIGGTGLTIYGAILGAILGIWVCSKFTKFQFGYLADLIAPGLILAQIIGRIGCTINGCCYGNACSLPWAVTYVHPDSFAPLGIAIHPTQPYEIIFLAIVFGIILMLRGRLRPEGSLFFTYLGIYSVWRLGLGFLREGTSFLYGLHQAQIIAIIVLAIVIPMLAIKTKWVRAETAGPGETGVPEQYGQAQDIAEESAENNSEVE